MSPSQIYSILEIFPSFLSAHKVEIKVESIQLDRTLILILYSFPIIITLLFCYIYQWFLLVIGTDVFPSTDARLVVDQFPSIIGIVEADRPLLQQAMNELDETQVFVRGFFDGTTV